MLLHTRTWAIARDSRCHPHCYPSRQDSAATCERQLTVHTRRDSSRSRGRRKKAKHDRAAISCLPRRGFEHLCCNQLGGDQKARIAHTHLHVHIAYCQTKQHASTHILPHILPVWMGHGCSPSGIHVSCLDPTTATSSCTRTLSPCC